MAKNITRRRFVSGTIRLAVVSPLIPLERLDAGGQRPVRFPALERRTLQAVADTVVPAAGRMPAASAVGAVGYIEAMATADAKLRDLIVAGLRAVDERSRTTERLSFVALSGDRRHAVLAWFETAAPHAPFFAALRDAVYEAYYTQPRIWTLLGYSFRSSRRPTARLEAFDERLLARVRSLPPLYRDVT